MRLLIIFSALLPLPFSAGSLYATPPPPPAARTRPATPSLTAAPLSATEWKHFRQFLKKYSYGYPPPLARLAPGLSETVFSQSLESPTICAR